MSLRQSPLAHETETMGFGGWEMPVAFDSIRTEHAAVRRSVGKFDVSHMGQIAVSGPDAGRLLQRLTTNDTTRLDPGEAQYTALTDERGIMLDDAVVYRLPASRESGYLFVPNAGHDAAMYDRSVSYRDASGLDATVENRTGAYAMVAVQGPEAAALLGEHTGLSPSALSPFEIAAGRVAGVDALVARTGYTGEPGFELLYPWDAARRVWDALSCQPCGLGARDTLRLEMGFLLSGEEFHPDENPRTPFEAGVGFAVDLDTEFVGRDALADARDPAERVVGVVLHERGVPRGGYAVTTADGEPLGTVTSGTMSPTLGEPIALAYLPAAYAGAERPVRVEIRGEPKNGHTTIPPFVS